MIIYLHGFNSSPESSKAQVTLAACKAAGVPCTVPQLPHRPSQAGELIKGLCAEAGGQAVVVGSSLGGYYATWLVENGLASFGVLINPAVAVADKLSGEVGKEQKNYHNSETYTLTEGHIEDLRAMEIAAVADPARYLLLVQEGDEVLDYREAVAYYQGCEQIVEPEGDHGFVGFERHAERIVALGRAAASPAA